MFYAFIRFFLYFNTFNHHGSCELISIIHHQGGQLMAKIYFVLIRQIQIFSTTRPVHTNTQTHTVINKQQIQESHTHTYNGANRRNLIQIHPTHKHNHQIHKTKKCVNSLFAFKCKYLNCVQCCRLSKKYSK